jgi:hypothetical protein
MNTETENTSNDTPNKPLAKATDSEVSPILSGAKKIADGNIHVGVAVMVESDGAPSTLMITDVAKVPDEPVYITKPIRIKGDNLKAYLKEKKLLDEGDKLLDFIADIKISCEAFYYSSGPKLMMFQLEFEKGLIETLTGDAALGKLFEIKGASVRVLTCPKESFGVLQQYVAELEA